MNASITRFETLSLAMKSKLDSHIDRPSVLVAISRRNPEMIRANSNQKLFYIERQETLFTIKANKLIEKYPQHKNLIVHCI